MGQNKERRKLVLVWSQARAPEERKKVLKNPS